MALWASCLSAFLRVLAVAFGLVVLRGVVWIVNMLVVAPQLDPLNRIPGPSGGFFESQIPSAVNPQMSPKAYKAWREAHGKTFRFAGFGKHDYRLMTFDFRGITHVLSSPVYEKPWQTRAFLSRLIGRGIFSTEGHEHKMQRKLLAPAFSSQVIKGLSPIFMDKAEQLSEVLDNAINETESDSSTTVNICAWLSRTAFDIIGLGGFDYNFNSLKDESESIHTAFRRMFRTIDNGIDGRDILELFFPVVRTIWPSESAKTVNQSLKEIGKAGRDIISTKRAQIEAEGKEYQGKDILSLLIKGNMSSDPSARLSDEELIDQCATFLLAGSDSSSVAMTWCFHLLATHPEIQEKLADELHAISNACKAQDSDYESDDSDDSGFAEDPSLRAEDLRVRSRAALIDAIESAPYLNGVIKETLRLYPPVHSTIRVATKDDEIPLAEPVLVNGVKTSSIKIRKGSYVHIPIEGINNAEDLWGPDVSEFKPLRWQKLPSAVAASGFPGIGHLLTFGYGHSSCIGSKFTVTELKIIVATLVSKYEFSPVPDIKINKYNSIITRPYVETKLASEGTQLPLQIRRRRL